MLYSQVSDTIFLLITVLDTKIRSLNGSPPLCYDSPKEPLLSLFLYPGLLNVPVFLCQFTCISERKMHKAGPAKSTILKKNTEVQNEIFMLGESGS